MSVYVVGSSMVRLFKEKINIPFCWRQEVHPHYSLFASLDYGFPLRTVLKCFVNAVSVFPFPFSISCPAFLSFFLPLFPLYSSLFKLFIYTSLFPSFFSLYLLLLFLLFLSSLSFPIPSLLVLILILCFLTFQ